MSNSVRVIGVHSIEAEEPVHLIEIEVIGNIDAFDFGEITQKLDDQPRENWQVAWDERELQREKMKARFAFFFHHLSPSQPLDTSFGRVALPNETPVPSHLIGLEYEHP